MEDPYKKYFPAVLLKVMLYPFSHDATNVGENGAIYW
jgi:hypothetical protein